MRGGTSLCRSLCSLTSFEAFERASSGGLPESACDCDGAAMTGTIGERLETIRRFRSRCRLPTTLATRSRRSLASARALSAERLLGADATGTRGAWISWLLHEVIIASDPSDCAPSRRSYIARTSCSIPLHYLLSSSGNPMPRPSRPARADGCCPRVRDSSRLL